MKHPTLTPALLVMLWALCAGCSVRDQEQAVKAPWESFSYLEPATTVFSLFNDATDSLVYEYAPHLRQLGLGTQTGILAPGDSVHFPQQLFRPVRTYLVLNNTIASGPYLLPAVNRRLRWNGQEYVDAGSAAVTYTYLKILNDAFPFRGDVSLLGRPLTEVHAHGNKLTSAAIASGEAFRVSNNLPFWLTDFYRREAILRPASSLESQRGYLAYAYSDTLDLPDQVHHWIDSLLSDEKNVLLPTIDEVRNYHAFQEASPLRQGITLTNRNSRLVYQNLADSLPAALSARIKNDLMAERVTEELLMPNLYGDKDELIAEAKARLPTNYVQRLDFIRDSINANISNDLAAIELLSRQFLTLSGKITPLKNRKQPLTLYKFWFPGCAPCVAQYPYEKALVEAHPEVELVYVGYETRKDKWMEYISTNELPTDTQLYLPKTNREASREALGLLGAPRYLLIGKDDVVICRSCPKPQDPGLSALIRDHLR